MESVPAEMICWNRRLRKVDEDLTLHFDGGHVERGFDLVVGADGAWSKVRNLVSDEKPFYAGLGGYWMSIPDPEKTAPEVSKLVNRGSVFVYSEYKMLAAQQLGNGDIGVSFVSTRDEGWIKETDHDPTAVRESLLEELEGWHPELRNFVGSCRGPVTSRNLYMLPVGFKWEHKPGVTLIGDAAHLMTPFAGIGANLALHDGMMLAHAIIDASKDGSKDALDRHVATFEKEMLVRSKEAQELTYGAMQDVLFTPGSPRTSIESMLLRHAKQEVHPIFHPLLSIVVYVGYFIYKLFV